MSDPTRDPAGHRAFLLFAVAEQYYLQPGLADRLRSSIPQERVKTRAADLVDGLASGELDYAIEYRSVALGEGLRFLALPDSINLGSLALAEAYGQAQVSVDSGANRVSYTGEPIVYGLTIPREALHREAAEAFGLLLLSGEGRAILAGTGLDPLQPPSFAGPDPPPAGLAHPDP